MHQREGSLSSTSLIWEIALTQGLLFGEQETQGLFGSFTLPEKEKTSPPVKKKKIIVLSGPTSVGKTELSLQIAKSIGGEIISADSMQVYRGMDIGTAKVPKLERDQVPHHLIDCRDLNQTFNVVDFFHEAQMAIQEIFQRDHTPIVVGGTGFYIHALLYGPPTGPPSVGPLRDKLEEEMKEVGPVPLYAKLKELDPEYAKTISERDRQKIIRGLEIISLTSKKVSFFTKSIEDHHMHYDFRCWFIYFPKEIIYPRIEMRCDRMIAEGFLEEVIALKKQGLENNLSASQAIGYRQCLEYLNSTKTEQDFEKFVFSFKQASRKYAKRQFTWFRKEPLFRWVNRNNVSTEGIVEMIIQDMETSF